MIEKNGCMGSFGRFEFEDGSIYEGCFSLVDNQKVRQGRGTLTFSSNSSIETKFEKYSGEWVHDQMHGFGVYEYINGAKYTGNWERNLHHGVGKYEFPDGSYYEGDWVGHLMHGEGTYVSNTGQSWTGEFRDGNFSSKMQNDLKAQKRIEVKKQFIRKEVLSFLDMLQEDLKLDRKILKDKILNLFGGSLEEEVGQ
jgi:hypothetical protein